MSSTESGGDDIVAAVLDVFPTGRSDDDRPQHQKEPIAYALGVDDFHIYELSLEDGDDITFGDRIDLTEFGRMTEVEFSDLPGGTQQEVEYAVEEIVEDDKKRFVDFYNDAQPITLRLHQLNLLPGIGKKLRNNILDERKRKPFDGFEDLGERISGLHSPKDVLVERIIEELREDDLKYRIFVRRDENE
jgi:putative nucleotide binding protein